MIRVPLSVRFESIRDPPEAIRRRKDGYLGKRCFKVVFARKSPIIQLFPNAPLMIFKKTRKTVLLYGARSRTLWYNVIVPELMRH